MFKIKLHVCTWSQYVVYQSYNVHRLSEIAMGDISKQLLLKENFFWKQKAGLHFQHQQSYPLFCNYVSMILTLLIFVT